VRPSIVHCIPRGYYAAGFPSMRNCNVRQPGSAPHSPLEDTVAAMSDLRHRNGQRWDQYPRCCSETSELLLSKAAAAFSRRLQLRTPSVMLPCTVMLPATHPTTLVASTMMAHAIRHTVVAPRAMFAGVGEGDEGPDWQQMWIVGSTNAAGARL
jgi:hypothetical protein